MLLIDAANVVGSRPTGWWRDRPGAARALVRRIEAASTSGTLPSPIVIVLEGHARRGREEGMGDGDVRVVHAAGSGDDALVELARQSEPGSVTAVTADRALRGRLEATGAVVEGPRWLLDRLPPEDGAGEA